MRIRGALCLSLAAAIWGGTYAFSNWVLANEYIQPFGLLTIRLTATAILLGYILKRKGNLALKRQDWLYAFGIGTTGFVLSLGSQFVGTKWAGAANGSLITSSSPVFITLFAIWLLKERITWHAVLNLLLATLGVSLVIGLEAFLGTSTSTSMLWGKLLLFIAGVTWGLYTVMGKQFSQRYGALVTTFWASVTGAVVNLPLALLEKAPRPLAQWPLTAWVGVIYISFVATTIAFTLWNYGFELLDASSGSLFFFIQPLVGILLGWSLLDEPLDANFIIGGILIAASLLLSAKTGEKQKPRPGLPSEPAAAPGADP